MKVYYGHPRGLVAQVDPALEQQVLDVPSDKGEADIHHHLEADHLGRGVEVTERTGGLAGAGHGAAAKRPILKLGAFSLTVPDQATSRLRGNSATGIHTPTRE